MAYEPPSAQPPAQNATPAPPPISAEPVAPSGPVISPLAVISLVCAIAGPCFGLLPDIAAIVLGILAIRQIDASDGMKTGRGVATAGIAIGALMLLLGIAYIIILVVPAFAVAFSEGMVPSS